MRRLFCVFIFSVCFINRGSAQVFGGNPPSTNWQQINTPPARIIFPPSALPQARQVAAIVQALDSTTIRTIGNKHRPINIIFQSQTTVSNGYVQLAPFRSEFELAPSQNSFSLGSLPWPQTLAIHEFRHVQQYGNFNVGLSRALSFLFGEGGQELGNSLSIPNWFWEGDAVYQETLVSRQGRGRLPFFFNGYKSLWAARKNYSWMKLRNGSYRDYVPDHYPLGYMLVSYGREKYGDDFWMKVAKDAASFKGLFYPFQRGISQYSGISFTRFRDDALHFFSSQYKDSAIGDAARFAAGKQHFVADEEYPQFDADGNLVFLKTSYKKIPQFISRDVSTGKEHTIKTRAIAFDNYFSLSDRKLVYASYQPDIRWGWRDYSVLRLLDITSGEEKRLTTHTKYFSPALSSDAKQIIAVALFSDGSTRLHLLSSDDGKRLKEISNPDSIFYTYPRFTDSLHIVSAVRNSVGEMAMAIIDINTGKTNYITPFSMNPCGFTSVKNDTIYFTQTINTTDRIFAFTKNGLFQLDIPGNGGYIGAYQPVGGDGKFAWATFSAVGYRAFTASSANIRFIKVNDTALRAPLPNSHVYALNGAASGLLNHVRFGSYTGKPYKSGSRLINFHSWRPYINDPDYSFSLVSENVLNTFQTEIFAGYNRNEQYTQFGVDGTYGALYPWITGAYTYTINRNALYKTDKVYWNEMEASGGLTLPLNFSGGRSYTNVQLTNNIVFNKRSYTGFYKDTFSNRAFAYNASYFAFTNQLQQAQMQIFPSFAQSLVVSYKSAITTFNAWQFLASGYLYLPGLVSVHSLVLGGAFQQRDEKANVRFSNSFPFSRGYSGEQFSKMYRLAANYHFPLCYPDVGFANIVYLLRIRANAFFDYTKAFDTYNNGAPFNQTYRSYGAEVYFDSKWWNQLPISFGIRYSRLMDPDFEGRSANQWELILPVNLLGR